MKRKTAKTAKFVDNDGNVWLWDSERKRVRIPEADSEAGAENGYLAYTKRAAKKALLGGGHLGEEK